MRESMRKLRGKARLTVLSALCAGALLLCAACAPQGAPTGGDGAAANASGDETAAVAWSLDADCAACHTDQQDSLADTSQAASNHAAVTCVTCHNDEAAMEKSHDGKTADSKMPKKLKRSKIDETACASCHSAEDLKAATADLTVLTDGNGTTVNPHDIAAMRARWTAPAATPCTARPTCRQRPRRSALAAITKTSTSAAPATSKPSSSR